MVTTKQKKPNEFGNKWAGLCVVLHGKCVCFAPLDFHFPFMKTKTIVAFPSPRIVESGWEGEVLGLEYGSYPPRHLLRFSA